MSQALDLAQDLIARRSVTPADEGCQQLIGERLAALGFAVEHLRFGNVDNLWARRGAAQPLFCFAGHTDVVPTGPLQEWHSDPFVPTLRDGVLYGRGAADMKTGLAAMVTATEEFIRGDSRHRGSIAFLITSDEEGPSVDGTKRVTETLAARGERIDWCLVGEPSSEATIAENPVHTLAPALAELTRHVWDEGTEHFQPTTFQVSNLNAGTGAPNVIPGELKARFNLRYSPVQTLEKLKSQVEEILRRHGVRYTVEWYVSGEPFYTPPGVLSDAVGEAVAQVTGARPRLSTGGGTSDGRFIAPLGAQVVELGVVNASIHKVNECVRIADVDALERMYLNVLRKLLT
jgi:succinyl-diaminopimelate desuccinylase